MTGPTVIPASMYREMGNQAILNSIDMALRVLTRRVRSGVGSVEEKEVGMLLELVKDMVEIAQGSIKQLALRGNGTGTAF